MGHNRDWSKYNKQLVNRGKINFWIKPEVLENWKPKKEKKNGHPFCYSNELIKTMHFIRFKISLRETEGFFQSLIAIAKSLIRVPCYTQVCRRMKTLNLPTELLQKRNVTDIALDTTGLKVYGEGEWRAEKYGGKKGSLAKIVSEGLEKMENESEREKAIRSLKAKMEKGFNSGGILIKHRSELYDRR